MGMPSPASGSTNPKSYVKTTVIKLTIQRAKYLVG